MISRLTASLDFHSHALTLRAERQRLIAGNIANADTPGYQARDFKFADAMRSAVAAAGGSPVGTGTGTGAGMDAGHRLGDGLGQGIADDVMRSRSAGDTRSPTARFALPSQTNLDSNTVDMDRERAASADNTVKYEATLRFINSTVRTTLDSMKSHTQG
jgi:flagellar basal-body rod protein FlgB